MNIMIIGAGIGGLTTALCCLYHGHDVTVFEQASAFDDIGAGIQIPPNAMKVFEALGLSHAITRKAFHPQSIEARMGKSGRHIFTIPLAEHAVERWKAPYLHIHRSDYIDVLHNALKAHRPDGIVFGAKATGYTQSQDDVTLFLADGRQIPADVLIGADGINSSIREQMLGPEKPIFTGNVAWRAVVPIENLGTNVPNPTASAWMGVGRHAVTYLLRNGKLANFVGVVEREDWQKEGWAELGRREEALKDFQGWHPTITSLIKAVKPEALFRWALFDRLPLPNWTEGRVALLGDAAHPMLPFIAQGAAMAVEDGWVLAQELSRSDITAPAALKDYQKFRYERTSQAQMASRKNMGTFHQSTQLGQLKTYGPMWVAGRFMPNVVHRRMDWLYGFDVTAIY